MGGGDFLLLRMASKPNKPRILKRSDHYCIEIFHPVPLLYFFLCQLVPLVSVYLVCTCGTVYSTVYKYTVFQPVPRSSSTRTGCSQVSSRFHYISKSHVVFIIKLNAHRLAKNIFKMDCQFALRRSLKICIFCKNCYILQ